ncbi:MAG: hypothetical protein HQK96_07710 [Nitrospirae bacterium]|nr:hypothetical protein [Nitrospirota bacterium]
MSEGYRGYRGEELLSVGILPSSMGLSGGRWIFGIRAIYCSNCGVGIIGSLHQQVGSDGFARAICQGCYDDFQRTNDETKIDSRIRGFFNRSIEVISLRQEVARLTEEMNSLKKLFEELCEVEILKDSKEKNNESL